MKTRSQWKTNKLRRKTYLRRPRKEETMSKLEDQIAAQAAYLASRAVAESTVNPCPPGDYIEPNVRTMLQDRLRASRDVIALTEAMLEELPEAVLRAPMSMFHRIF